jgi:outer membrane immunogenic protein
MKKLLVAGIAATAFCGTPALAADLPVKGPVYKAAPVELFNWSGCYIGANTGGAWANKRVEGTSRTPIPGAMALDRGSYTADGWAYGGQIGCDYQFNNNWVVGIRGMWDGAHIRGSHALPLAASFDEFESDNVKIGQFGTMTGKLGYLLNPTLELYGLAGVAWVRDHYFLATVIIGESASATQTRTGYDVGVGLSWMFARNWDLWVEYDYMGFGGKHVTLIGEGADSGQTFGLDVKQHVSKVLVGIDYRFDWGKAPVSAKY